MYVFQNAHGTLQNADDNGKRTEKRCPDSVAHDLLHHLRLPLGADLKKQSVGILLVDVRGSEENVFGVCKGFVSRNLTDPEFKLSMTWPDINLTEMLQVNDSATSTWMRISNAPADYAGAYVVKLNRGAFKKRVTKSSRPMSPSPSSTSPKSTSKRLRSLYLQGPSSSADPFVSPAAALSTPSSAVTAQAMQAMQGLSTPSSAATAQAMQALSTPSGAATAQAIQAMQALPSPSSAATAQAIQAIQAIQAMHGLQAPPAQLAPRATRLLPPPSEEWVFLHMLQEETFIDGMQKRMKELNSFVHEAYLKRV